MCVLAASLAVTGLVSSGADTGDSLRERVAESYGALPLRFEENRGQTDREVEFLSRGPGYALFLTPSEAVLSLSRGESGSARDVVRMRLLGASRDPSVKGVERLPGTSNYLSRAEPARQLTGVPSFGRVRYASVYPGIDLVYHGRQRALEYDFVVAPGADPRRIALDFEGVRRLDVARNGDLIAHTGHGALRQKRPVLYQRIGGERRIVEGSYRLEGHGQVGFRIGSYDRSEPLVIDPVLSYATYLGGALADTPNGIAVDAGGNAYITGTTASTDFPTASAVQANIGGGTTDAFVSKLNATGSALVYSTYLGGGAAENGRGIAVDPTGAAYVTGETASTTFPTANAVQATIGGSTDAFLTKLNPAGSAFVYSTFLGGSGADVGRGIALENGRAHVTGSTASTNFPLANAIQATLGGGTDAFVTRFNAAGSALEYSSYLGGSGTDNGRGIAVDATGAYVAGDTASTNFPTANALQAANGGATDAFVSKLNAAGSALTYSTYLGGTVGDNADAIAVRDGSAYVTGDTDSTNFPTANAVQGTSGGSTDAFITKLNAAGSALAYSTYLGGKGSDGGNGIAVDSTGRASIAGSTSSGDLPVKDPISIKEGNADMLAAQLDAAGSALTYSTPFGGSASESGTAIAADASNAVYITGSSLFFADGDVATVSPTAPYQANNRGNNDALIAKIASDNPAAPLVTGITPRSGPSGTTVEITGRGFTGVTGVTFGGSASPSVTVNSPTKLTARSPLRPEGYAHIRVTNAAGSSPANPAARFMYAEGTWTRTGPLNVPRQTHTTTLLHNGKVLAAGGRVTPTFASQSSSELYDPKTGTWSMTPGSMTDSRFAHSATLLDGPECDEPSPPEHCGKVLVAGGFTGASSANAQAVLTSAELFDPDTGTWTPAGTLGTRRALHAAILLEDGRVLVAGGRTCNAGPPTACNSTFITATAEIYDPATNGWTPTANLTIARHTNGAALLPSGQVLIPGGFGGDTPAPAEISAELYSPADGPTPATWATCPVTTPSAQCPGPLNQQHARGGATLLPSGEVIVAAGFPNNNVGELYDPDTGTWTKTGDLKSFGRFNFYYALLPNGKYLLAGGGNGGSTAELYDPETDTWSWAGRMNTAHGSSSSNANSIEAVVLSSDPLFFEADRSVCGNNCGKVLISGNSEDPSTDLYTPPSAAVSPPVDTGRGSYPQPASPFADCPTTTANVLRGTAASNSIVGTPRADRIFAGAGDDTVDGLAADDCIDLGPGTDRGQGGDGNDLVVGDLGRDRIAGGSGNDRLRGGASGDRLIGGFGGDRIHGQSGADRLNGERGRDRLFGGSSGDVISAGSSGDRVAGDRGNDRIDGNSGNDSLRGNSGRDRIKGSSGRDRISGGSGNDRVSARDGQRDRINCGSGRDTVFADRLDRVARNCERVFRRAPR